MTHKILINYRLSDKGIREYFLAGNKQEEKQEIWIETDSQKIIDQAKLVNNEYLQIDLDYSPVYVINFRRFENSNFFNDEQSVIKDSEIDQMVEVEIDEKRVSFYSDTLLTEKAAIEILSKFGVPADIQARFEKYQKICAENDKCLTAEYEKERAEREARVKVEEERKEKQEAEQEAALDAWVDAHGSETCKLRKKYGYDYFGLARNEFCDTVEFNGEKVEYDNHECNSISKPRLEILKALDKINQNEYVENAEPEKWTEKLDYYDGDEPESFEVIEVEYKIFGGKVTRHYKI